jgi:hypothetical protein
VEIFNEDLLGLDEGELQDLIDSGDLDDDEFLQVEELLENL